MTTIAFDGKTLASDSRATGNYVNDRMQKIFKVKNGYLAGAGDYSAILVFKRWYESGQDFSNKPKDTLDFEAIVISGKNVFAYDSNFEPMRLHPPCAMGSGCHLAMAAMDHGATAREAIKTASKYDENTGGRIKTVKIK